MSITNWFPWKREKKNVPVRREPERAELVSQESMSRMFDDFFGVLPFEDFFDAVGGSFNPKVDIVETDKAVKVSAELPGVDIDDIDISLSHGVLTISGEKHSEVEDKGKNYYRVERSYGSFRRSISLPCEVDESKVDAIFKKGVLDITLPKTQSAQDSKHIKIKTL